MRWCLLVDVQIARYSRDLRHQRSSECLEEESDGSHQRGKVSSKTAAESQKTGDEGHGSEEEGDQVEREHEARQVEVLVRANKLLRNTFLCAKVPRRVEGQRWDGRPAVRIVPRRRVDPADRKEGPSRRVSRVGNAVRGRFEEVEFVQRSAVDAASEDVQELEEQSAGDEDERTQCEDGSCVGLLAVARGEPSTKGSDVT
jgi:hypothetical protein